MRETAIHFEHVKMLADELLADGGLGGTFRIGERELFVPRAVSLSGTTVTVVGEVGKLVLPRWFVEKYELVGGRVA